MLIWIRRILTIGFERLALLIVAAVTSSSFASASCHGRTDLVGDFEFNFGSHVDRVIQTLEAAKSIVYHPDVTVGDIFKVQNLEQDRPQVFDQFSVCRNSKIVIHGDISKTGGIRADSLEHGQQVLLLFEFLVDLKTRFPDQVTLLIGNNDRLFPSTYKPPAPSITEGADEAVSSDFWTGLVGRFGDLEAKISSLEASLAPQDEFEAEPPVDQEAIDELNERFRRARSDYAQSAQLMVFDPNTGILSMHGGIPRIGAGIISLQDGFVGLQNGIDSLRETRVAPAYLRRAENVQAWVDWMNSTYKEAMQSSDPEVRSALRMLTSLGADSYSAVTARPTENAALVDLSANSASFLQQGGVKLLSYAHTPAGDLPALGVDPSGIVQVMLDLSESITPLVKGAHVSSDGILKVEGFVSDQAVSAQIDLKQPLQSSGPFLGRVFRPKASGASPADPLYQRVIAQVPGAATPTYLGWTVTRSFKNEYRFIPESELSSNHELMQTDGGFSRETVQQLFPPRPAFKPGRGSRPKKGAARRGGKKVKNDPNKCKKNLKGLPKA